MSAAEDHPNKWPITVVTMVAATMVSLDTTIANVALPHIQGSVSASQEQIAWVLTSYIVAAAIATPLTGWLADRVGRKLVFLVAIVGFTLASLACGMATGLGEIVVFRLLQGVFGAPLMPLSQAILLDINRPEKHGQAMSIWGCGVMLGPILGPALGGWLTEHLSWRWVFLINLPVGVIATIGVLMFISDPKDRPSKPFDVLGFASLAVVVGAIQLMLDRGPSVDWFSATETWVYVSIAAGSLWVFVAHSMTTEHPFFDLSLARDRNFVSSCLCTLTISVLVFSTMTLLPPMLQGLMGYSVLESGLVFMPRGMGTFISMLIVGNLVGRVDTRLLMVIALGVSSVGVWMMTQYDLSMGKELIVVSTFLQGVGIGLYFSPLTALAFATIAPHLRGEASSFFALIRSMGSSVGISIMQALMVSNTQVAHSSLAARIIPEDPAVAADLAGRFDLSTVTGLEALNGEITRQAAMIAILNDYRLMLWLALASLPIVFLLRPPKHVDKSELPVMHE